MNADELTKEQVEEMSDAEVVFWCGQFAEQEKTANMRKYMLTQIEIQDADHQAHTIRIDSKVVK